MSLTDLIATLDRRGKQFEESAARTRSELPLEGPKLHTAIAALVVAPRQRDAPTGAKQKRYRE